MQIYVKLYLESMVRATFDLVRKIKAGFPREVLIEQKSETGNGVVGSTVLSGIMTFQSTIDRILDGGVPDSQRVW